MQNVGTSSDSIQPSENISTSQSFDTIAKNFTKKYQIYREAADQLENLKKEIDEEYAFIKNAINTLIRSYYHHYEFLKRRFKNPPVIDRLPPFYWWSSSITKESGIGIDIDVEKRHIRFVSNMPFIEYFTFNELQDVQLTISKIKSGSDRYAKYFVDFEKSESIKRYMKYKQLEKEFGNKNNPDTAH